MNKKSNKYKIENNNVTVELSNCNKLFSCDLQDWDEAKDKTWSLSKTGYPVANVCGKPVTFHRFIFPNALGDIDHIDGNKLKNNRNNLRIVTHQQNLFNAKLSSANKSGKKGVCWHKKSNKWMAYITIGMKRIYLGLYEDKDDAIKARKKAEKEYFGEYARAV